VNAANARGLLEPALDVVPDCASRSATTSSTSADKAAGSSTTRT
jgi:hypothetical protein